MGRAIRPHLLPQQLIRPRGEQPALRSCIQGRGCASLRTGVLPCPLTSWGPSSVGAEAGQRFPGPFQSCNSDWTFLIMGPLEFLLLKAVKHLSMQAQLGRFPRGVPRLVAGRALGTFAAYWWVSHRALSALHLDRSWHRPRDLPAKAPFSKCSADHQGSVCVSPGDTQLFTASRAD